MNALLPLALTGSLSSLDSRLLRRLIQSCVASFLKRNECFTVGSGMGCLYSGLSFYCGAELSFSAAFCCVVRVDLSQLL